MWFGDSYLQKETEESSAQYRGMVIGHRAASKGRRAAPARSCLLTGIIPWEFWSLAEFELGEKSSTSDDELILRLTLPPLYMAEEVGGDPGRDLAFAYDAKGLGGPTSAGLCWCSLIT